VTLFALPGYIELEVTDDGQGIEGPLEKKRADARFAKMRERLSLAGGDLHIDSTENSGTRVRAWVAIDTEAA
jgi:signal transduction histidine kinase